MSNKTLVVVESPSKAKTINKYLGKDYIVEASVGHIKDLIKFGLGVDVNKGFQPKYTTIRGKADVIKKLKSLAEKSQSVLIATDPDREGEAIAWHIAEEVTKVNKSIKRVLFNEITKSGIQKGLNDQREIDENLVMSQQARRVMDRLIGFKVSPFLSNAMISKTSQALSAGRVQSVALRLICEREAEIISFVPIDYWSIFGNFSTEEKTSFKAKLVAFGKKNIKNPEGSAKALDDNQQAELDKKIASLHFIRNEELTDDLIRRIRQEKYAVSDITTKLVKRNPYPPFTTSSLQQEASKRLGFSNKKTMIIAQSLYEGISIGKEGSVGLITYMRTDSVRLSPESQEAAREYIDKTYGKDYLPPAPPVYTSKSAIVQDAHEAIRPTSLDYTPEEVRKYTEKDVANLYELIYNRFVASQMSPAQINQTNIIVEGGEFTFKVTGSVIMFKGFLAVYDDEKEENGTNGDKEFTTNLPKNIAKNQPVNLDNLEKTKSQTKPKPRYTEASLIKELDEKGIGRPSTYASIVSTIVDRNYVELQKKAFYPTELGIDVNGILTKNFPDLFNVDFTADMEQELDTVANGEKSYKDMLTRFYGPFSSSLQNAEAKGSGSDILCDVCGAPMIIKVSKRGRFLGCSKYPECTNTKPLPKEEKAAPVIAEGVFCDICGKPMYIRDSKYGKFYGCTDYPNCKGVKPIVTGVKCPKCGEGTLLERFSAKSRKKFWGCSNYPKCDFLTNYEPLNQKCPKCGNYFIEARFRKKDGEWERYLRCPGCGENFENESALVTNNVEAKE